MRKIVIALLPIIALAGCESSDSDNATFDIECNGKPDGWNNIEQQEFQDGNVTIQLSGEWYCRDNKLSIDDDNAVGKLVSVHYNGVTNQIDEYHYYSLLKHNETKQEFIIQELDANETHIGDISSNLVSLHFGSSVGIYPQLLTPNMTRNSENLVGPSYQVDYDPNTNTVNEFFITEVLTKKEASTLYRGTHCEFSGNTCSTRDYEVDSDENIIDQSSERIENTTHPVGFNSSNLENPAYVRKELNSFVNKLDLQ